MQLFKDKVIVVTGAASGMGEALALALGEYGATILAVDVNEAGVERVAKQISKGGGHCIPGKLDVSDEQAFTALLKQCVDDHGTLDYLFNNAGIAIVGEARDTSRQDWQRTIDINQMGVMYGTLAAYEIMQQQGSGHIVNTASVAGLMPAPLLVAYSMTKHAVVGLSLSLREEAKNLGINVSVVCPGLIKTNLVKEKDLRNVNIGDPFEFLEMKMRAKAVSPADAATYILKGVVRNQAEIVFPLHGKLLVRMFRSTRFVWEKLNAITLQQMRGEYRQ